LFKKLTFLVSIVVCLAFLSGCISNDETDHIATFPQRNRDPIPIISISGLIIPKPILNSSIDGFVYAGDEILLDASPSYDPDGKIQSYEWIIDEENTLYTDSKIKTSYFFDERNDVAPKIIQLILSIQDNNGSISFQTYLLGILPKRYTFYLEKQWLSHECPDSSSETVKATFGRFREIETLTYTLENALQLQKCIWNVTLYIEKPLLSFLSTLTITLYNSNETVLTEENFHWNLFSFWKQQSLEIQGKIIEPTDIKKVEIAIIGFSFGKKISILYGGNNPSSLVFDFIKE